MVNQLQAFAPHVYGIVGGAVNVFVLDDTQDGLTVIDTGLAGMNAQIIQLVKDIGRTPQDIRHILVTHADIDHVGGLKPLVDISRARVYASAESKSLISHRQLPEHLKFPMVLVANVVASLMLKAVEVDQVVKDGDVLPIAGGIRVLATPGHTPDHVSYFWERERMLFTGDLLRNKENEGFRLTPERSTYDMGFTKQSAKRSLALDPAVICMGHGLVWHKATDAAAMEKLRASL